MPLQADLFFLRFEEYNSQMQNTEFAPEREFALRLDSCDPLRSYRERFFIPQTADGKECIYLCGNSLGLQPKTVRKYVEQELRDWEELGVEGHFHAKNPWMPYHEFLTAPTARLVGAKSHEVVVMNTLTVNLHLLMVSFYRPTTQRNKVLIEYSAFPSDQYAVKSQIEFHGYNAKEALVELKPKVGQETATQGDFENVMKNHGKSIALLLIGGVNYYSGQLYDMARITEIGHKYDCIVGFDLAHAVGNVPLQLHDWNVDFAAWCTYKYLNSGPGSIAGCFIHEKYAERTDLPRFTGWWGHEKSTRFQMGPDFVPIKGAEGWQISNPPILSLAAIRASLQIFDEVGMPKLREKSLALTNYMEYLIDQIGSDEISIITPRNPQERGCQLSIQARRNGRQLFQRLSDDGVICDWREPDVIRVAPVPLYNSFMDVYLFSEILRDNLRGLAV
jgi:kynureninase